MAADEDDTVPQVEEQAPPTAPHPDVIALAEAIARMMAGADHRREMAERSKASDCAETPS